ncbi:MAG: chemotaxis protein CheX [Candidatus Riflebacteria bacterium]|nr:chemotaxis protein CheX [Candidatus Riflebacteria bacterium]
MAKLDANVLNQFILASISVFEQIANIKLSKDKLQYYHQGFKWKVQVATILGLTGAIKGQIILSIDEEIAKKVASAILMGEPVNEFNEIAESGVCEIANMIGGDSAQRLNKLGLTVDVSVPSIIRGNDVEIGFSQKSDVFVVDYLCEWGKISIAFNVEVN